MTITVWKNGNAVVLHQLSDDPKDGTADEQIAHLGTLDVFAGFECVSRDYVGGVPGEDSSLWRWSGGIVIAVQAPPTIPASITRRQCARQLFVMGMISGPEAVGMTRNGTPPAMVQAYLDTLPETDQYTAEMDFAAENYYRDNPLLNAIMAAGGHSPGDVDQFFIAAAAQ